MQAHRARWPAVVLVCLGACRASGAPSRNSALVGAWRVVQFCDDDSTGRLSEPYGAQPSGVFVYAPDGQLSIQIARTPGVPLFASGDEAPSHAEQRALFASYMGYFGRYTITSDSTVVHHVTGGTMPSYNGTDQARVYRIRGDTLTIGGSQRTWPCRVLLRTHREDQRGAF